MGCGTRWRRCRRWRWPRQPRELCAWGRTAAAITGTTDEMCETLLRRRDTLGISYVMVGDELMDALAPVVERLAGR
jgi:hypothetical protein